MRSSSLTPAAASPPVRLGVAAALVIAIGLGAASPSRAVAATASETPRTPVVAILLAPFVTYRDLSPDRTPALWSLAEKSAIGSVNAMTADAGWPTVAGGALTLSAGRWAAAAPSGPADAMSLPAQRAANAQSRALPELGALGEAVRSAGGRTAAVGTSDPGTATVTVKLRPAELVACDASGTIDFVATGPNMLVPDARAPLGVRSDRAALASAISSAVADLASGPSKRGLLVVDPGDLARAHVAAARPGASASTVAADHDRAMAMLDDTAADLTRELPSGSLLIVVTTTTDKPYYEPPYFGPVIVSGDGLKGVVTSSSTHRPGLITGLDIAPTVLDTLGIPVPDTMIGNHLASRPDGRPLAQRFAALSRSNDAVGAVDKLRDLYFIPAFAWFAVAAVSLAMAAAFTRARLLPAAARLVLMLVMTAPSAAWVSLLVARYPATPFSAALAFAAAWLGITATTLVATRFAPLTAVLALLSGATGLLILADQWFAGPLESGLFSYSIRAGWRYYGIGNEGAALLVAATLAAVGLACDMATGSRWERAGKRYALPIAGAMVLVTAAGPFAGANAGVAIWGFIAFAVAWLRVNRIRFTPKTMGWTLLGVVGLVAVLAAADRLGGNGGTHIGRFFLEATRNGAGSWELVRRKALNNLDYLSQTPYSWVAAAVFLALAAERFAGARPLDRALARVPAYRATLVGILIGSAFALITEDSGIVMPALMLLAGALPALYLTLVPVAPDAPRVS